ncbi:MULTISPECIES: tripartite tricarboxylate transporter substrate binding protein [unclassified Aminobacter]|uniref:Bug family tripartite tricarboxylate transporter substrate binding protein n=1 Tax=unclassified Aminobacter TaxID=2644704 RepID=UPI0004668FDC|nr:MULTISPECIES: tripartite tricarboxylate transporter substrate binding protein [unclassified Aminobacter]TWG67664.1 tripartite-type tricarboxylate transporter receptor subunit TctC [Aminobacter sp. J44]TWH28251.1 tripartite-type tricarboxylate transporter receptor subunit TctC [Aminobacter sp. J15]
MRISLIAAAAALVTSILGPSTAIAEADYPSKPVRIVIGFAAGGGTDTIARMLAEGLSKQIDQPVVVENRPGAGGTLAASYSAAADPDGYTLYFSGTSTLIGPVFVENAGYDPVKSFAGVANINETPLALVAGPSFPADDVRGMIEEAKAKPGELFYATPGVGTTQHLLIEMLEREAGIDLQDAPYQGAAPSIAAVISGEIPLAIISLSAAIEQAKGGKIKILGITSPERVSDYPDIPAIGETVAGYGALPSNFLVSPAGTPQTIIDILSDATASVVEDPEFVDFLKKQGLLPKYMPAAELDVRIASETAKWTEVARSLPASGK